mmetsp:Transcript_22168/g.40723  ORF Transcript_22168/g.40723 Transcript_22168/m.40723 type:complete len:167 (+) Transcript_22168:69-569(+)
MKVIALLVAASMASTSAFMPAPIVHQSTQLNVATKGKVGPVKNAIASLTKDNFSATLTEIEPFLTKEAGMNIYIKSMKRITVKAAALGVDVPANFAKEAKCTEKRRAKQSAYCQVKTDEAAAAVAEAAEAAAAEAAAAVEAAAAEVAAAAEAAVAPAAEEEAPAAE